jgi:AcrR family transcriptional regulator
MPPATQRCDPPARRRRDAAATRQAILAAAVAEFTEHGYAGVGVRQIARRAGVTAMLINRYFGSKESLFAEVVEVSLAPPTIVGAIAAGLAGEIGATLAARTATGAERLDPFLLMLRSAADPAAGRILRRGIERHVGARLAGLLDGPDANARAQVGLALISGIWLMRTVLGTEALASWDESSLAALLTRMVEPLIDPGQPGS